MNPVVVALGGGVNSKAMVIEMVNRGEQIDLILFADTGGEKPDTYADVEKMSKWLLAKNYPYVITVRKTTKRAGRFRGAGEILTLERRCLEEKTLPSIAYGFKSCSQKFKREPQDEFVRNWQPAIDAWGCGEKVVKLMGYDAGEPHRANIPEDKKYLYRYPLVEWGWDREECIEAILRAGLCVPPKSSCFFCPSMDEIEILSLREEHPELLERALAIERNAVATEGSTIKGLGRDFSWQQILEYDAAQMKFFPRVRRALPCECYDGSSA